MASSVQAGGIRPGLGQQCLIKGGNMRFANCVLQCLSNTGALTRYFLEKRWEIDLNATNPIGMKGKLAAWYYKLLRDLWGGDDSSSGGSVCPDGLKEIIRRFAPQLTDSHDAMELLAFLLDGLHEDLNRIRSKPFVEAVTGNGTDDGAVSALAWARHRLRNDSFVLDTFSAQYRSELICPKTGHTSVMFEPYYCVSVQVPEVAPIPHLRVAPV